jgi:hypothetical protein
MADASDDVWGHLSIRQDVYDCSSEMVGVIAGFDRRTGWIVVEAGHVQGRKVYVPFRLVTNIDQRELYLARTRDELVRDHRAPPPRTIEMREVARQTLARTTEPSGYDGSPVVVHEADVDQLRRSVAYGDRVWTSDQVDIGSVEQYDPTGGFMIVERGVLSTLDLIIPIALVEDVERRSGDVRLVASRADLLRMQRLEPVSLVVVTAGVRGPGRGPDAVG